MSTMPSYSTAFSNGAAILFDAASEPIKGRTADGTIVDWHSPSEFREWVDANLPAATVEGARPEWGYVWHSPILDLDNSANHDHATALLDGFLQPKPAVGAVVDFVCNPVAFPPDNHDGICLALLTRLDEIANVLGKRLLARRDMSPAARISAAKTISDNTYHLALGSGWLAERAAYEMGERLFLKIWLVDSDHAGAA